MKIAIIGTGNVAWHLILTLENAGHVITAIAGREPKKVASLAENFYNAEAITHFDLSEIDIEVAIICVTDDAIEDVSQKLRLSKKCLLAHSSGTKPLSSLGYAQTENIGVFYPLQTFTKAKKVDFSNIPICIEADNKEALRLIRLLASSISNTVVELTSKDRAVLHLAAVFACNFSNHMLTISHNIMEQNGLNYALLHPLITETINKSLNTGPQDAQTGPAKRGDLETLDMQYHALSGVPETADLYKMISQHILNYYSEED